MSTHYRQEVTPERVCKGIAPYCSAMQHGFQMALPLVSLELLCARQLIRPRTTWEKNPSNTAADAWCHGLSLFETVNHILRLC